MDQGGPGDEALVTVVLTTCDRPDAARRAAASAVAQSHPAVEVVVVDDGLEHRVDAAALVAELGGRVRVLATTGRCGANVARNAGLAAARGRWTTFLDDDDELTSGALARAVSAAAASDLEPPVAVLAGIEDVRGGQVVLVREPASSPRGAAYRMDEDREDRRLQLAAFNSLVAPTEVLRGIGGFDERIQAAMHTDLMLRLNAVCAIEAIPEVGYRMHHHPGARLSTAALKRAEGMLRTWEKHRDVFGRHPRREAAQLANVSTYYLKAGRWRPAVRWAVRALRADPTSGRALRGAVAAALGPRGFALVKRVRG